MKRVFSIILLLSLMLILCSCGGNSEPPVPAYENLTDITMQEYMGDEPVGMEVSTGYDPKSYHYPGGTYFYNPGYSDWKQITNDKKLPQRDTSLLFRFTDKSGVTTEVFLFGDDHYDYLEIPGAGVWRDKKDDYDWMHWKLEKYQSLQFSQCYAEPVLNHGRPYLLESYNGSEKAIMVDIREGYADDDWWVRCIPDEWAAERAEDVRYVFVLELLRKEYRGYFYYPETGEKGSSVYDRTYSMTIYDLVDGSEETLYTGKDSFAAYDTVEEYFSR